MYFAKWPRPAQHEAKQTTEVIAPASVMSAQKQYENKTQQQARAKKLTSKDWYNAYKHRYVAEHR